MRRPRHAAMAVACVVGVHTYQSQRAASAGLRPVVATLSQAPPLLYDSLVQHGEAEARWRDPGGCEQSGVLTIWTVPGLLGAAAGAQMPVWLNRSGQPVAPLGGQAAMIINALAVSAAAAWLALLSCYVLCRLVLDRRRLTAWESAWSLTEPRWTTRR